MDANLPESLRDKREDVIRKSLATKGVRAVQKEIALQRMLVNK